MGRVGAGAEERVTGGIEKGNVVFSASEQMTGRGISEVHNALRQPDWQAQ